MVYKGNLPVQWKSVSSLLWEMPCRKWVFCAQLNKKTNKKKRSVLKTVNDRTHGINYTINSKQLWNYKHCLVKAFPLTMPWCRWHSPVISVRVILLERRNFFSKKSLSKKSCLPGQLNETSCSNGLCHVFPGAWARQYELEKVREKSHVMRRNCRLGPDMGIGWFKSAGTVTK